MLQQPRLLLNVTSQSCGAAGSLLAMSAVEIETSFTNDETGSSKASSSMDFRPCEAKREFAETPSANARPIVHRIWNSSQGIRFRTSPRDKIWRPSQDDKYQSGSIRLNTENLRHLSTPTKAKVSSSACQHTLNTKSHIVSTLVSSALPNIIPNIERSTNHRLNVIDDGLSAKRLEKEQLSRTRTAPYYWTQDAVKDVGSRLNVEKRACPISDSDVANTVYTRGHPEHESLQVALDETGGSLASRSSFVQAAECVGSAGKKPRNGHHGTELLPSQSTSYPPFLVPKTSTESHTKILTDTGTHCTLNTIALGGLNLQASRGLAYPSLPIPSSPPNIEPALPLPDFPTITYGRGKDSGIEKTSRPEAVDSDRRVDHTQVRTPLGFHIPKDKFQHALLADRSNRAAYWQYTLYQGPGGDKDLVKVHYCKNKIDSERVAQLFLDKDVVGFDIEWKPHASAADGIKKNVALIQVASEEHIALFHIARYPNAKSVDDFIAPALQRVMEFPDITKVGVAIKGDATRLKKFMSIEPRGLFELSHMYKLVKYYPNEVEKINKKLVTLAQQVHEHLQLPLWKGDVRSSDWSKELSSEQIRYAASDSYAGFHLYYVLDAKRLSMTPVPPRPAHVELNLPIRLADCQTVASITGSPEPSQETDLDESSDSPYSMEELACGFSDMEIEGTPPPQSTPRASTNNLPANTKNVFLTSAPNFSSGPPSSSLVLTDSFLTNPTSISSLRDPPNPKVISANEWASAYIATLPLSQIPVAKLANLRAYALWEVQGLEKCDIAKLLRDPPLQLSTVASYILGAIADHSLSFRWKRAYDLIPFVHMGSRSYHKRKIAQRIAEMKAKGTEKTKGRDSEGGND